MKNTNEIFKLLVITSILVMHNFFAITLNAAPKNEQFLVEGEVFDGDLPVSGAVLNVYADNSKVASAYTNQFGGFKLKLIHNIVYTIEILKKGYVAQKVLLDCNVTEAILNKGGIGETFDFTISIYQDYSGLKTEIFLKPVVYYVFNSQKGWYFEADNKRSKFNQLSQLNTKVNQLKYKDQQIFMQEAAKILQKKNTKLALVKYVQASNLNPFDEDIASKLDEILKDLKKNDELVDLYKEYIEIADNYLKYKKYDSAYLMYTTAKRIYTKEKYIDKQITTIDSIQSLIYVENKAVFDTLRAQADRIYEKKLFDNALTAYQKALKIFPNDSYVKDKIAAINKIYANEKKQKELEAKAVTDKFEEHIKLAQILISKQNYAKAIDEINGALLIVPNDSLALTIKQEVIQKQKVQLINLHYLDTLVIANEAYKQKKYKVALDMYKALNKLKPAEDYPIQKMKEIKKAIGN